MGQLNFFMTNEEIANEINQLLASHNYTLYNGRFFNSETPESFANIDDFNKSHEITIWINNNQYQPRCSSKGAGEMAGKFLFDYYKDPIIEFDIGLSTDNLHSPSGLFYKTGWVDDNEVRKLHIKLTNELVRSFKKKLTTTQRLKPFYISESVIKLLNKNHELELGKGGLKVNKHNLNGI